MKQQSTHKKGLAVPALLMALFASLYLLMDREPEISSAEEMLRVLGGYHVGALCLILCLWVLIRNLLDRAGKRDLLFSLAGGFFYSLCDFVGFNIYFRDSLTRLNRNLFSLALDITAFLGAFSLFFSLLLLVFLFVRSHPLKPRAHGFLDRWLGDDRRSLFGVFGLLMLISIPLQIFFWPGITNADSFSQIAQATGMIHLMDNHPFVHTLMMQAVIRLGRFLFGSIAAGVCLYTLLQSVLVNLTISYTLTYMAKRKIHPCLRLATLLYFAIHPAIACYTITLWKDIWLSYFFLLYTILLIEAAMNTELFFRRNSHMVGLLLVTLGFLFSKNTGIGLLILSLPVLCIVCRKYWKRAAAMGCLALILWSLARMILIPALNIEKWWVPDAFSVPFQQMARTYVREGEQMTPEQVNTLGEIMPLEDLPKLYNPSLSDRVKGSLNVANLRQDRMRYVKLWAELGRDHPRQYLESFLANSCGYWYPDVIYWVVESCWYFTDPLMTMFREEAPQVEDTYDSVNWKMDDLRHYFVHLYELLQRVPGISTLLGVGINFWAHFLLVLICLYKKKYKMLVPMLVPLTTWILCLFSPVIAEYRYAFPAVVTLPMLAVFTLQDQIHWTEKLGLSKTKA